MAIQKLTCSLSSKTLITSILSRSFSSFPTPSSSSRSCGRLLSLLRPLSSAGAVSGNICPPAAATPRPFSTRTTSSSLNDPSPNWSNRPPKETILLDGCDFEHWLVVMEKPEGDPTRDEIIDRYIKTLAQVVGSEEEARMKIYSVSTRCYFAFGALVSEELSYKLKELPGVRWVLPDSYLDVKNKDYGGEPFINGQAVPYDPKYHEEWIRNNSRANERNRRNDRPRNFDRSRNFERRRENMQNRDFQNSTAPPMGNQSMQGGMPPNNVGGPGGPAPPANNYAGGPGGPAPPANNYTGGPGGPPPPQSHNYGSGLQNNMGGMPPQNNMGQMPPNNMGGMPPQNNMRQMPPQNMGQMPPQNNMGGMPPQNNMGQMPPQNNMGGMPPQNNMGQIPPNNVGGMPPNSMRGMPSNAGGYNNISGGMQQNFESGHNSGGVPYQGSPPKYQYQNNYSPNEGSPNMPNRNTY